MNGTFKTIQRLCALSSVAVLLAACGGGPSLPTALPPPPPPPPPAVTYVLSGAVSEMTSAGSAPVQGARVIEMVSGRTSVSDQDGRYSIDGLTAISRSVSVTKAGYIVATGAVTMSGDTELDIRLERIASYVLSGVVFEMTAAGQVPVEGVELYCDSCGSPVGHTFVYTNAAGAYRFEWSQNGVHPLFVTKAGYDIFDPTGELLDSYGRIHATVRGDTRFDVQLVRR
ncbi:MAG TPA: carboxypeptidase-like regulatory domain-containing protein [Vicinamibacterales bacterium]|nr:carboxypeptidase-like regulatory domain-containing protein [Vicinamibacterales bacterium]